VSGNLPESPRSSFGAAGIHVDYAPPGQRVTWGTRTRQGDLCFSDLRTLREARRLKAQWDEKFPDYAPYSLTRNGRNYCG
jgi:hypothetical protein